MKNRSELFSIFQSFFHEIKTQFEISIRNLRSDNGHEYLSQSFKHFMASEGILHQTSCTYTPQQNGMAERKNRHLIETTHTLLIHGAVPSHFWGDAVFTACYLINRIPSSVLHNQVPHSILFPHDPLHPLPLKVFGSTCFVHDFSPGLDKLSPRAHKYVLGFPRSQKGYKCFSPSFNRHFISADVTFDESSFYFTHPSSSCEPPSTTIDIPVVCDPPSVPTSVPPRILLSHLQVYLLWIDHLFRFIVEDTIANHHHMTHIKCRVICLLRFQQLSLIFPLPFVKVCVLLVIIPLIMLL